MHRLIHRCTENLLVSVTICYIAGASTAAWLSQSLSEMPLVLVTAPMLISALVLALGPRVRLLAPLPLFVVIGLVHTHWALQPVADPFHIATLVSGPAKVTLVGRMQTMAEYNGERTRFELDSEALLPHTPGAQPQFRPVRGKVQLTVQGAIDPQFVPGKKIMVMATVDQIRNYQTPGAFDYRLQMATKGIFSSGWIQSPREILPVAEPHRPLWQSWPYFPEQVRQHTAQFLSAHFEPNVAGLFQALLVGSTVNIAPHLIEAFKDNGCFHVLSISGLHLSLLGVFCTLLFTWLLKRSIWLLLRIHVPTLALVLTAPVLLFYTFIAGFNIPAIRSLAMALLVLFAVVVRRQRTLIHLIAAAALFVLTLTPLALFTPSFQLSFAAVLAINLIFPRLPLLLPSEEAIPAKHPQVGQASRWIQSMLYVSLAATAGTLPILLYHFNRFSLIGPVMNLVIEPLLCLWALPFGLLAIPLIPLWPDLAQLLLQIGRPGIDLTIWLAEAASGFPYASLWTITPDGVEIVLYYLVLFLLLRPRKTPRQLALALGLALLLTGSFTRSLWFPVAPREMIAHFLDVGEGTSTLVQLPSGASILIDGGGHQTEQFDPGQNLIAPFLWRQRIWRLNDLVVTHPHQDHVNGLPFVAARFRPRRLIVNGDEGENPSYQRLLNTIINSQGATIQTARAGDVLHEEEDLRFTCLGMNDVLTPKEGWSTNDRSLVLRLQYGTRRFLFPGDISVASEYRLLQKDAALKADVLLAPHHGSRTSASDHFLAAVDPALIVVATGRRRLGSLPDPEHLRQWQAHNIRTLITGQEGTVTCRTDGRQLQVATFAKDWLALEAGEGRFVRGK